MAGAPVSVCDVHATLGEGPVWVERDRALWFVDIKHHKVHRFDPEGRSLFSWEAPRQVGWILPAKDNGLIAGLQDGLYRFDPASGRLHPLRRSRAGSAGQSAQRCRDRSARAGSGSDRWTMARPRSPADFYRFDRGAISDTGLAPVAITNGPALSPDGRLLYHTDTLGQVIHVADIADDGTVGNAREFVRFAPGEGYPDGPIVDCRGLPLDGPLRWLGGAALLAGRPADGDGPISRSRTSPSWPSAARTSPMSMRRRRPRG